MIISNYTPIEEPAVGPWMNTNVDLKKNVSYKPGFP